MDGWLDLFWSANASGIGVDKIFIGNMKSIFVQTSLEKILYSCLPVFNYVQVILVSNGDSKK